MSQILSQVPPGTPAAPDMPAAATAVNANAGTLLPAAGVAAPAASPPQQNGAGDIAQVMARLEQLLELVRGQRDAVATSGEKLDAIAREMGEMHTKVDQVARGMPATAG